MMPEICQGLGLLFAHLGWSQDKVGWHRFLEGMVVKEVKEIQCQYLSQVESKMSIKLLMMGLIVKLLKITHRQWILQT